MNLTALTANSPVDGRYRRHTMALAPFFSEFGLIKYRVRVEVEYFIALCELPLPQLAAFDKNQFDALRTIYTEFTEKDALAIKEIEKTTNHDVKAVEYFLKQRFDDLAIGKFKEFIHFGLTSQDINNTAIPLSIKEAHEEILSPMIQYIISELERFAKDWAAIPMLAKTHGQPASPTRLGKEIRVFSERLKEKMALLKHVSFAEKLPLYAMPA